MFFEILTIINADHDVVLDGVSYSSHCLFECAQLSAVLNAACVCLLYVCVRVRRRPYVSVRWRVRCHGNRHMAAITCSEEEVRPKEEEKLYSLCSTIRVSV